MKSPNQASYSYFHLLNGERLKAKKKKKKKKKNFPPEIRNKRKMSTFITSIQCAIGNLARVIGQKKNNNNNKKKNNNK